LIIEKGPNMQLEQEPNLTSPSSSESEHSASVSMHEAKGRLSRHQRILDLAAVVGVLRTKDVVRELSNVPRRTLERDLSCLAAQGLLIGEGRKKGRTYRLAPSSAGQPIV